METTILSENEVDAIKRAVARGEKWPLSGTDLDGLLTSDTYLRSLKFFEDAVVAYELLEALADNQLDIGGIGENGDPTFKPNGATAEMFDDLIEENDE